jgi:hypothetical protein
LAAAISLLLVAVAGCQMTGDQAPKGVAEFPPQPHRRFIRAGSTGGAQFTQEEFRFLARNFDYVLLAKFHGGFDIQAQHEAAHRLKELNPSMRVFPYFSTKYWFEENKWDQTFDPAWYLRDNNGNIVYRARNNDKDDPKGVAYVDLANPEYRTWALNTLRSWLDVAPYAGISFDAAEPIGDYGQDVAQWERLLGRGRIEEYNAGMRALLAGAQRLVGPDREVIFNGIAPNPLRGPDRNLDLLDVADGALNERFCLDVQGGVHALGDDLALMQRYHDRRLFLRTNYPDQKLRPNDRERYGRFCLGSFLLGWRPGLTYYQFGDDYTADQLRRDIPDMNVPIGTPAGPYQHNGDVLSRPFTNGAVYVNVGDQPAQVALSRPLISVDAGQVVAQLEAGDTITVPPLDAVFLLDPTALTVLKRAS